MLSIPQFLAMYNSSCFSSFSVSISIIHTKKYRNLVLNLHLVSWQTSVMKLLSKSPQNASIDFLQDNKYTQGIASALDCMAKYFMAELLVNLDQAKWRNIYHVWFQPLFSVSKMFCKIFVVRRETSALNIMDAY